jgi:hypothetical protein
LCTDVDLLLTGDTVSPLPAHYWTNDPVRRVRELSSWRRHSAEKMISSCWPVHSEKVLKLLQVYPTRQGCDGRWPLPFNNWPRVGEDGRVLPLFPVILEWIWTSGGLGQNPLDDDRLRHRGSYEIPSFGRTAEQGCKTRCRTRHAFHVGQAIDRMFQSQLSFCQYFRLLFCPCCH